LLPFREALRENPGGNGNVLIGHVSNRGLVMLLETIKSWVSTLTGCTNLWDMYNEPKHACRQQYSACKGKLTMLYLGYV
jgi:hypothetical protein